jgi:hypothetical protein
MPSHNPYLKKATLEVVENQLCAGEPPETKQTLDRLIAAGHSTTEAKELIGCVLICEIYEIMRNSRPFDRERYVKGLEGLPTPPWDQPDGPYAEKSSGR